jgi:hypothetical protein
MKKLLLSLLLAAALLPAAFAQTPVAADTVCQDKWEVGTDLLWLLNKNQVPAGSIFLRRHFTAKSGRAKAFRLRAGLDAGLYSHSLQSQQSSDWVLAPYVRPGLEWRQALRGKVSYFYGIDADVSYYYRDLWGQHVSGVDMQDAWQRIWRVGAFGLLGLEYRAAPWLALSAEASISLQYAHHRDANLLFVDGSGETYQSISNLNILNFGLQPLAVFNLTIFPQRLKG